MIVDVKGVGKAQFPDDMPIENIREFLRRKYSGQVVSGETASDLNKMQGNAQEYKPSLSERMGQGISNALYDNGIVSDRYGAQRIGDNLSMVGEVLPGIGDATAGDEAGRAIAKGNYGEAALHGAGSIPLIGDLAIFAGVMAKNADLGKLAKAKELETSGINRDEIWKETGWFNDRGDWKFEIDDGLARVYQPTERFDKNTDEYRRILRSYDTISDKDLADEMELMDFKGTAEEFKESQQKYWRGQLSDISGSNFPLELSVDHNPMYEAYPSLKNSSVKFQSQSAAKWDGKGSYQPKKDLLTLTRGDDEQTSVALHELQHAIQEREGFAKGGSPDSANHFLKVSKEDALRQYSGKKYQAQSALFDMGKYGNAEYIAKLDRLSQSENIKPSSVTGLSDWYQYIDQIREKFGAMPKTNAKGRNQWLQSAAAFIKNRNLEELDYYGKQLVADAIKDPKRVRSEYKKAERVFKKYEPDFKKYSETERGFQKLEGLSDFDKYKRLAGEAEARLVQTRMNLTPEERLARPPWQDLDVPEDELIYRNGDVQQSVSAVKKASKGPNPVNIFDTPRNRLNRPEKIVNLPQGNAGASEFERIKELDPRAKVLGRLQDGTINVSFLDEYKPKQVSESNPYLFDFDPDALEITETTNKNIHTFKGDPSKPIAVTKKDGDFFILDGHHRTKIAKEKGKNIQAVVIPFEDVEKMKKDNIHQGDMLKEWAGNYYQTPTKPP